MQSSLFPSLPETGPARLSAAPIVALPCPGNCAALRYAEGHALDAAYWEEKVGAETDAPCAACSGRAVAVVSRLAPLTIRSRGGIPYRPAWVPWEEWAGQRRRLLQKRVIGVDWRQKRQIRRCRFLPGWSIRPVEEG